VKIRNWSIFIAGMSFGLFSLVPFAHMNHADKFQVQKCNKLTCTISDISIDYKNRSNTQDGWLIGLKEYAFKVRIVGEYFNVLDHDAFAKLVKPNVTVEVLLVKRSEFGLFERINEKMGFRDAAGLKVNGTEVLSIEKLNQKLSSLYAINLTFGIFMLGISLFLMYKSTK